MHYASNQVTNLYRNQQVTRIKHFIKFVFEKTTRGNDRPVRLRKLDE